MEKLTAEQILEVVADKLNVEEFGYGDFNFDLLGLGGIKVVDEYGGEGQGDDYWTVYHFVDHDVYIRVEGWYSSYNGAEFDNYGFEVRPEPVMKIEYNRV